MGTQDRTYEVVASIRDDEGFAMTPQVFATTTDRQAAHDMADQLRKQPHIVSADVTIRTA